MKNYFELIKVFAKTHKDSLIFASGVAGTAATGVTGVRAGIRIERKRRYLEEEKGAPLTKKEIVKVALPELVPVIFAGTTAITCQSVSFVSMKKKIEGLTATAAALSTQIDKIKKAEKEVLGEDKAAEVQKKAIETPTDNVPESHTGKFWFKEDYSGAEVYTTDSAIYKALGELNYRLTFDDASLNDFFFYVDHSDQRNLYSKAHDDIGWRNGTKVEIRPFRGDILDDGTPCKLILFSKPPKASERKW